MTDLFLAIAVLLFSAKILGELFERFRLSSLVGEITAGVLVGPVLGIITASPDIGIVTNFGILLLMFLLGMSSKFDEVKSNMYVGSGLALSGCALTFLGGFTLGYFIFNSTQAALMLGAAVLSSSTAISLRCLSDRGMFQSKPYKLVMAIGIADDVIAIISLALITSYFTSGSVSVWEAVTLFMAILGFFFFVLTAGSKVLGRFLAFFQTVRDEQILVSMALVVLFALAYVSEHVGVAAVTGTFLAGVALSKVPSAQPVIVPKVKVIAYGFFIPMFFAYSATLLQIISMVEFFPIIMALVAVMSACKFIGCGLLSGFFGYSSYEQKLIGISTIAHGEYSILIAQLALFSGFIQADVYTIVVSFVIISIIITPMLLAILGRPKYMRKF